MDSKVIETPSKKNWMSRFVPIWTGQIFSLLGSAVVQFALVWWLTQKTGSATVLTTATLVALLPEVLLAPFAGALVDRWNRRWVMVVSDASIAIITLTLVVLFALNKVEVWQIYGVLFLRSIGGIFHWPAMQASTTLMVPREHYSRIAGINQAVRGALNIIAAPWVLCSCRWCSSTRWWQWMWLRRSSPSHPAFIQIPSLCTRMPEAYSLRRVF